MKQILFIMWTVSNIIVPLILFLAASVHGIDTILWAIVCYLYGRIIGEIEGRME
jgi:hypothetical protein